ncbi:MAG: hypothetical protein AAFZ11_14175 [Pseudomonadota bacterium]
MKTLGKSLAGLFTLALAGFGGLWAVGAQQPNRPVYAQDRVLFVALKRQDQATNEGGDTFSDRALWRAKARSVFIGEGDAHFTDFALLPFDADYQAEINAAGPIADAYVAEVELLSVPSFITGLLRTQHLLGITRRPDGPLPTVLDEDLGRPDLMPTLDSSNQVLALPADTQVTMMNFLEYFPTQSGDKEPGRQTYQRYGAQAMRSVHAVGGQFLFAGKVSKVLVPSKAHTSPEQWDDLAAMIYPSPEAIFYMEQFDYYQAALGYRDDGLKSTRVVASVSY